MIENIITGVVLTSICVLGILGNSVTLLILNSNHQMRNQPINIYLTVLALFDNGVLFNAILMLGIPGIYKLMHDPPPLQSAPEEMLPDEKTFSPTAFTGKPAFFHADVSEALAAMSAASRSNFSAVGSQPSPPSQSSSSISAVSLPLSSESLTLVSSQYPASHTVLRTSPPRLLQQTANYASVGGGRASSFPIFSSASSRVSSPWSPLLHRTSQLSSVSASAPLTTKWRSKRRRRDSTEQVTDSSLLFNIHPQHSSPALTTLLNQRHPSARRSNSPAVDASGTPYLVSLTSSSGPTSSTTSSPLLLDLFSEARATKHDVSHPAPMTVDSFNQTLIEQWDTFSELISSWDSLLLESNDSAAELTSPADIFSDPKSNLNSLSVASLPDELEKRGDPWEGASLLLRGTHSSQEASSSKHEEQGHDPSGGKGDGRMANSRLLDDTGLFPGDELIFAPPEDDTDLMSANSSASEGPLHLYIQFVYPLALISQTGSIWTTCLITAERYFAIAHPLRALTLSTRKRATWALISMSILAVLYNLPRFAEVEIVGATEDAVVKNIIRPSALRNNRVYYWVYYICIYLAVLYIIPLTLLSVLNTKIYLAIKRANRDRSSLTQNQESEMNIATMLVALVAIFIACNLPAFIVNCLELVHNSPYFHIAMIFSNFLVCFNSSVNFVIYCTFGKKFRERLHETFCCSSGRLPRRSTPIRNRKTSIVAETLV